MMKRREFITLLGGAAATWPVVARGQQSAFPVVGVLSSTFRQADDRLRLPPFREGLGQAGYVEGRNVTTEFRWADDQYDRLPVLAADLLHRQPAVIATFGGPNSALAAKAANTTVPIVFTISGDPIKLGLVASFDRPGGNVTGVTSLASVVAAKQFEALYETVPSATVLGCLINPNNPNREEDTREAQKATQALGVQLEILHARDEPEIETAFATLAKKRVGALVIFSDGVFNSRPQRIATLAARYVMPTSYSLHEFAQVGGLMSYGTNIRDAYRQAGVYTGRILKGDKPGDLAIFQATKVQLIINLKTAKALGLTMPTALLVRADEVIE
jgi:putative tryptophan/tyrosine transport system substrate-binding protein